MVPEPIGGGATPPLPVKVMLQSRLIKGGEHGQNGRTRSAFVEDTWVGTGSWHCNTHTTLDRIIWGHCRYGRAIRRRDFHLAACAVSRWANRYLLYLLSPDMPKEES